MTQQASSALGIVGAVKVADELAHQAPSALVISQDIKVDDTAHPAPSALVIGRDAKVADVPTRHRVHWRLAGVLTLLM